MGTCLWNPDVPDLNEKVGLSSTFSMFVDLQFEELHRQNVVVVVVVVQGYKGPSLRRHLAFRELQPL